MADLFLHLAFARRLRLAEGLHPLIGETLARRPALVALGAALPLLPGVERKGMSFFMRLFSRGAEAARWQKQLASSANPRPELVKRFVLPASELGPMARLSVALGVLAHELVEAATGSPAAGDRASIERAQARLWLQAAVPNARQLDNEWRPIAELADPELQRRAIDHIDAALKAAYGAGPGRDAVTRWMKGLVVEVAPAAINGLPPSLAMPDHVARGPHFENIGYVGRVQEAVARFVSLADRLGERLQRGDLDAEATNEALCAGGASMLGAEGGIEERRGRWTEWQRERRSATLLRGRNDRPAFLEGVGEVKAIHRSSAFTGMLSLSDIPQDVVPPELRNPSLPPEAAVAAPPLPAMTQEVSLAAIEAAAAAAPPSPGYAPPPAYPPPGHGPPAYAPAGWSQPAPGNPDAAQGFAAPAMTQEISVAQIEAEARAFAAPMATQEISIAQIEAAGDAAPTGDGERADPPADPPRE